MKVRLWIIAVLCIIYLWMNGSLTDQTEASDTITSDASVFTHAYDANTAVTKEFHVFYILYGGINQWSNPDHYKAGQAAIKLRIPYRYGYTFSGWYLDKNFTRKIEQIDDSFCGDLVLYAKWTDNIDNRYNVEHYDYHASRRPGKNTRRLKDCEYSFCDNINIPGMPSTREDDFLNNYIFSESQCPQGICLTDELVLVTSYSTEDDCMGELLVFDRATGEFLVTLGMDPNSHLGGIAFDGQNVWVCNSYTKSIERISYDFIQTMAAANKGSVVDATDVVDIFPVNNAPSCITYYGGRLWVATHTKYLNSRMVAYYFDSSSKQLKTLSKYHIPSQVQGITFGDDGSVYLSTSYGRNSSSYIKVYESVTAMSSKPKKPVLRIEMPPGSEEIDFQDDALYVIFESAGEKYYEGTDGKGTSTSPIDKILQIRVDSLKH